MQVLVFRVPNRGLLYLVLVLVFEVFEKGFDYLWVYRFCIRCALLLGHGSLWLIGVTLPLSYGMGELFSVPCSLLWLFLPRLRRLSCQASGLSMG